MIEKKLDDVFDTVGTDDIESQYFVQDNPMMNRESSSGNMTRSKRHYVDGSSEMSLNQQLESVSSEEDEEEYEKAQDDFQYEGEKSSDRSSLSISFQ